MGCCWAHFEVNHTFIFHNGAWLLWESECDFHMQAEAELSTGLSCKWAIWFYLSFLLQRCVSLFDYIDCLHCLSPSSLCFQIHKESWLLTMWALLFFSHRGYCVSVFRRRPERIGGGAHRHTHTHTHTPNYTHIFCEIDSGHIADVWYLSQSPPPHAQSHFLLLWTAGSKQKMGFHSKPFSQMTEKKYTKERKDCSKTIQINVTFVQVLYENVNLAPEPELCVNG